MSTPNEHQQDYDLAVQDVQSRLQYQVDFAQTSLRGLMLINGGAIVALFTFIGNTSAQYDGTWIWRAFGFFVAALAATVLAGMGGFVSQALYMHTSIVEMWNFQDRMHGRPGERDLKRTHFWGNVAEFGAIGVAFVALVLFIIGAWCALSGVLITR